MPTPSLVLLDVNETLVSLDPLGDHLEAAGAPRQLVTTWFAGVLRDGFALSLLAQPPSFRPLAEEVLSQLLHGVVADPGGVAASVLDDFGSLPLHEDVVPGLARLADAGCRLVTLTNGSADITAQLLAGTEADALVSDRLDVAMAGEWKPLARPYTWACEHLGVEPADTALVAVHAWDVAGARAAGLQGAYLDRSGAGWRQAFGPAPDVLERDLPSLAAALLR